MPRHLCTVVLTLFCLGALFIGCKQKSKEDAEPAASASVAAPAATPEAPPPVPTPIAPPIQPVVSVAPSPAKQETIKPCCAALHKEADSAAPATKASLQTAANGCDAIAKLVAAGTTKKAAALTQIRASLRGAPLPAGCN